LNEFVVEMEKYGIPQARHRVMLLGIREDIGDITPGILKPQGPVTVRDVLFGIPPLRSGLSEENDDLDRWRSIVGAAPWKRWFSEALEGNQHLTEKPVHSALSSIRRKRLVRGGEFLPIEATTQWAKSWYLDKRLNGICNHSTRSHLAADLHRYFYAAVYAQVLSRSPTLGDFPRALLPHHANVQAALNGGHFSDRFRVQLADRPATTITSHISKDGHYYIHYDPAQCRSLTVREAARLQTFPDNYFFCGPRTAQYTQVGNAVPPLLARRVAEIVRDVLK
jgi:DNA (cytosine-5)-methyltransferase 1